MSISTNIIAGFLIAIPSATILAQQDRGKELDDLRKEIYALVIPSKQPAEALKRFGELQELVFKDPQTWDETEYKARRALAKKLDAAMGSYLAALEGKGLAYRGTDQAFTVRCIPPFVAEAPDPEAVARRLMLSPLDVAATVDALRRYFEKNPETFKQEGSKKRFILWLKTKMVSTAHFDQVLEHF